MSAFHLIRRALGSLSNRRPGPDGVQIARAVLLPGEFSLWSSMQGRDQHHSLVVLERFRLREPGATRAEQAAALLHDVGKSQSNLGWASRIVATLVGPRGARFAAYHDHELIGSRMLASVSESRTVDLVSGSVSDRVAASLEDADNI